MTDESHADRLAAQPDEDIPLYDRAQARVRLRAATTRAIHRAHALALALGRRVETLDDTTAAAVRLLVTDLNNEPAARGIDVSALDLTGKRERTSRLSEGGPPVGDCD